MQSRSPKTGTRGVTLVETTVALGLLVAVMSIMASLAVRNQRLLADNRAYRLAVDELSNRLDALVAMPPDDAEAAIEELSSEELSGPLKGATLAGDAEEEDVGQRLTLTLSWPGVVKRRPDLTLTAWSFAGDEGQEVRP